MSLHLTARDGRILSVTLKKASRPRPPPGRSTETGATRHQPARRLRYDDKASRLGPPAHKRDGKMDIEESRAVLEISASATPEEIRTSYRDLVQVWHPDRYEHNPRLKAKATEHLKLINEAYALVSAHSSPIGSRASAEPPASSQSGKSRKRYYWTKLSPEFVQEIKSLLECIQRDPDTISELTMQLLRITSVAGRFDSDLYASLKEVLFVYRRSGHQKGRKEILKYLPRIFALLDRHC